MSHNLVSQDLVSHDLVSHDLMSHDLVSHDLVSHDLVVGRHIDNTVIAINQRTLMLKRLSYSIPREKMGVLVHGSFPK